MIKFKITTALYLSISLSVCTISLVSKVAFGHWRGAGQSFQNFILIDLILSYLQSEEC